jgi:aminopeptidase N
LCHIKISLKKIYLPFALFAFVITLFSQCGMVKERSYGAPIMIELDTIAVVSVDEQYHPSERKVNDLLHTKLNVSFDWQNLELDGVATLTLKPWFYPTSRLILDAKNMLIHNVRMVADSTFDLVYTYDNAYLDIQLSRTFSRFEKYTVEIEYTARPEMNVGGSDAITSAKGLYFINADSSDVNKPTQVWTQGETEASSCWFPTIDSPNERMSQELFIRVRKDFITLSNGNLVYSDFHDDGTKTDYWKQDLEHPPYLTMLAAGDFMISRDFWTKKGGERISVDYYMEPEYAPYAFRVFGSTPKMLSYFSEILDYEYPWDKYAQIVVRDYVSGAMENTSAVIHGEFLNMTDRELIDYDYENIIAHELFHHWFGDLVTCESWSHLPLNESFATYAEYLWLEHSKGRDEADHQGLQSASGYFEESRYKRLPLIRYDYVDKEDMFDAHSYNKGGRVLHMLRAMLGDDAFFASLQTYIKQNAFNDAELDHFRLACEEVTGQDLAWFFDQWFLKPGHPVLNVSYFIDEEDKKVQAVVRQMQEDVFPTFAFPAKIMIETTSGQIEHDVFVTDAEQLFNFPYVDGVQNIVFDAAGTVLCQKTEVKDNSWWMHQLNSNPYLPARAEAFDYLSTSEFATEAANNALRDGFWAIRMDGLQLLLAADSIGEETVDYISSHLTKDKKSVVRAEAIQFLADRRPSKLSSPDLIKNVTTERSPAVMSAPKNALVHARKLSSDNLLTDVVGIVLASIGEEQDISFFDAAASNGASRSVIQSWSYFLGRQPVVHSNQAFPKMLSLIGKADEKWWIRAALYHAIGSIRQRAQTDPAITQNEKSEILSRFEDVYNAESAPFLREILDQYR